MALTFKIAVLAGDGIGPEVMAEGIAVLQRCAELEEFRVDLKGDVLGGASVAISNKDGKINATFESDDVNLRRLVKASEGELSRAFARKGMRLERLEVTAR